jgi:hypothetical protein
MHECMRALFYIYIYIERERERETHTHTGYLTCVS